NWARRELFEFFSSQDYPFYSVTIPIDVTNVKKFSRDNNISFYYLMIWLVTKAINAVPAFKLRIRNEKVFEITRINPSFTDLKKTKKTFILLQCHGKKILLNFVKMRKFAVKNKHIYLVTMIQVTKLYIFPVRLGLILLHLQMSVILIIMILFRELRGENIITTGSNCTFTCQLKLITEQ
ncbi:MAG: CatA-like O-acetyltransferase, partial [Oscillospiraceae bacterium]